MLNPLDTRVAGPPHLLLLIWLCLVSLVIFGSVVSIDQGLLQAMLSADRSQICIVVIAMTLVGFGHTYVRTELISSELVAAERVVARLETDNGALSMNSRSLQFANGDQAPHSFITNYLVAEYDHLRQAKDNNLADSNLLEAFSSKIRSANEFGWFYIDLMLKIGFLGTLVGFILMLSSVADTGALDATTMQKVLKHMSLGMSTALYTTLASLVGGILLSLPYYLLDRGLERLLQLTVYAKDVLLPARLSSN
ncbi:MAG: hypothetical protein EXR86_02840 [Gammaproteobacteria bacterium]|nr:hypothetical protein [Gammaproteobacteria bacterium]